MRLSSLEIRGVRNLKEVSIAPGKGINLLYGDNGAGKTSLLESIFILSHGRSFRAGKIQTVVNDEATDLSIFASVENEKLNLINRVGIMRGRDITRARINGETVNRMSDLAVALPCLVISVKNHELIEGGPTERRSFLDWLLFHVDQSYLQLHRRYKNAVQQRNAALRSNSTVELIGSWDNDLSDSGEQINQRRIDILEKFVDRFNYLVSTLDEDLRPTFSYRRGWSEQLPLIKSLKANIANCQRTKMTSVGPHRADLKIMLGKNEARYVNSRGQQKLLAIIMKLVQVDLFTQMNQHPPIVLIDDPPSELDQVTREFVFSYLEKSPAQVFLTSVDDVSEFLHQESQVFHVERGSIQKVIY